MILGPLRLRENSSAISPRVSQRKNASTCLGGRFCVSFDNACALACSGMVKRAKSSEKTDRFGKISGRKDGYAAASHGDEI